MMKQNFFVYCAATAALVASGLTIAFDSAKAQQASEEQTSDVIEEIVEVESPIERERVGPTGMTIEIIGLRRQVSFADLDLSKHADVTELERRVETTAKESCEKLEDMYPLPRNPSRSADIRRCTKKAIEGAAEEIQLAVETAR